MDDGTPRPQPNTNLSKRILRFYQRGLKIAPLALMLCHWYGVFDYHTNPREVVVACKENQYCIMYLYAMAYVFPVLFMLPASYFFKLCWIWRIPFTYFIGVNVSRLYFGALLVDQSMTHVDYFLVSLTASLYVYAFIQLSCSRRYFTKLVGKLLPRRRAAG